MDNPQFLYHYTDLESLILILKNRTIRLKSLDQLDDKEESSFENFRAAAKYIFVSSWTEEEKESIPFWKMYTRDMHGVRIKLPLDPFKKCPYHGAQPFRKEQTAFVFSSPSEQTGGVPYDIFPISEKSFFYPVEYTEDEKKLSCKLVDIEKEKQSLHLEKAGVYKRTAWDFQKEWRYRVAAIPAAGNLSEQTWGEKILLERLKSGYEIPMRYMDLELEDDSVEAMEIVAGPKMTEGEFEILKTIVAAYLPAARIEKSRLRIR